MPRGINAYDEARLQNRNVADATAINTVSPGIVTDGLVLHLDAGNRVSYPTSGTLWYDVSNENDLGSLIGTPTYGAANGGYISFAAASSQYATIPNPGSFATWTLETVVQFTAAYNTKIAMVIGGQYNGTSSLNFSIGTNNAPTNYNIAVGFYNGAWRSTTGVVYNQNIWIHITGTYDGATVRQYTNGSQVDSLSYAGTPSSGGEIRINRRWDDIVASSNLLDSNVAIARIYNRALTPTEVEQNFNATRARFGI